MRRNYMTKCYAYIEKDRLIDCSISLPRALLQRRSDQYHLLPSRAKIANFFHFCHRYCGRITTNRFGSLDNGYRTANISPYIVATVALNHASFCCGRTRLGQLRCGSPWLVRGFLSLFLLVVLPSSIHIRSFLNP